MVTTTRKTAEERREEILDAACLEFALAGLHGTSTDAIARRAGVSQPYLFRLFHTKRELFLDTVRRCFAETLQMFEHAAQGRSGDDALHSIGAAYAELLADRTKLQAQMQAYVACDDPEVQSVVRAGYGSLVEFVERVSGADPVRVSAFFAQGMLLNVIASMGLLDHSEPWATRLMDGCKGA